MPLTFLAFNSDHSLILKLLPFNIFFFWFSDHLSDISLRISSDPPRRSMIGSQTGPACRHSVTHTPPHNHLAILASSQKLHG